MLVNFDLIPQMTACRVGVDENICRDVIMFHWKLVADLLSSATYTKVRVKGFANFEMKRIFLKKYYNKSFVNITSATNYLEQNPQSKETTSETSTNTSQKICSYNKTIKLCNPETFSIKTRQFYLNPYESVHTVGPTHYLQRFCLVH